uniref:Pyrin domain-containing protein n=1 Tax=Amphilophus citrinellus TaxID=61819 RepID=A0A3Q0QWH5_AMPCI
LTIQSDREKLLGMLDDLRQNELENFKWFLGSSDAVMGLPCIPKSRLEKVTKCDLVDLMLQTYTEKSVEVTKNIFKKINRNDLESLLLLKYW